MGVFQGVFMKYAFLSVVSAILLLAPFNVLAANCASPTGSEGQVRYDSTTKLLYYCDGTNWKNAGGSTRGAQIRVLTGAATTTAAWSGTGYSITPAANWTQYTIVMNSTIFDNGGWVNPGGYFVIPAGVSKVRVTANFQCDAAMTTGATYMSASILKNDAFATGSATASTPGYIPTSVYAGAIHFFNNIQSGIISVTAGDTIKFKLAQGNTTGISQNISCRDGTWMEIQAVE